MKMVQALLNRMTLPDGGRAYNALAMYIVDDREVARLSGRNI